MSTHNGRAPRPTEITDQFLAELADMPTREQIDVALAVPNKSAPLLSAILQGAARQVPRGDGHYFWRHRHILDTFLEEPNLDTAHLEALVVLARLRFAWDTLEAICAHPQATRAVVVEAFRLAPRSTAPNVAAATGSLFAAAYCWASREFAAKNPDVVHGSPSTPARDAEHKKRTEAVHTLWSDLCDTTPGMAAFLTRSCADFDDMGQLLAAGQALLAAPTRS